MQKGELEIMGKALSQMGTFSSSIEPSKSPDRARCAAASAESLCSAAADDGPLVDRQASGS
jgi:hypothetical protein